MEKQVSRHRVRKNVAREILENRDWAKLKEWAVESRNIRALLSLTFDADMLVRWRAIEAMGIAAEIQGRNDMENVREIIRNILWMMNDESGALAWHGPETIAEILYNIPSLISEYGKILGSFTEEEPFERGTFWAIARISLRNSNFYQFKVDELIEALDNPDTTIKGYSLLGLKWLDYRVNGTKLGSLQNDNSQVYIYNFESGKLKRSEISKIVQFYLNHIDWKMV
ncbi:MAG: hypothetical protein GF307_08670 [candidate division Zixibacteria bacterium]|nr:hypothetical protein [candidate division Zixibacteria bacterium]